MNKTYWTDEAKATPGAFPLVDSDNDGIVVAYFDGDYRFQVKDSGSLNLDVTIDWDNVKLTSDSATMWEGNLGTALPTATAANKGQLFALENAGGNLQSLKYNKGTAFVNVVDDVVRAEHFATINLAITDIGASVKTLVVQNIQTVATNLTIPSNVTTLYTGADPQVSANSGVTVTHNGPIISARPIASIHTGVGTHAYGIQSLNLPLANSVGGLDPTVDLPATQLTTGAIPVGVTLPATQVTSGAFIAGVTLPADQLAAETVPSGVVVPLSRMLSGPRLTATTISASFVDRVLPTLAVDDVVIMQTRATLIKDATAGRVEDRFARTFGTAILRFGEAVQFSEKYHQVDANDLFIVGRSVVATCTQLGTYS